MITTSAIVLSFAVAVIVVYYFKDPLLLSKGLRLAAGNLKRQILLLFLILLAINYLELVMPRAFIENYLGDQAGFSGIVIAGVIGTLIPSGPYVVFPLAATLYSSGAGAGSVLALMVGWMTLNPSRLPFELLSFNHVFTFHRYIIFSFSFAIVMVLLIFFV